MFVILESWRFGLFAKKYWLQNIVAGVIVGIVALPLAMAFAIASGVKPEQGLYTAIIAGLAVSVLGGSRTQIAGPTGAFIVILSAIVAEHGVDGLQIATLMAGVILLLFGIARLGVILKFIPAPVIVGFTAGIGIIIWVGQWKDFFGLPQVVGKHFHEKFWYLITHFTQLDLITTTIGILSLVLVVFTPKIPRLSKVPGPLVALVIATLVQSIFQFDSVATIHSTFGQLPSGLPRFALPDISLDKLVGLIGPAFAIAMLGAIESLLSAVVADSMAGTRHNSNQELIGQGVANVLSPMFGGIAATGAIARTATNIRNGGNSPLAGIVHVITLVVILIVLAPLAANIPLATLAAVLFMVAWNMSDVRNVVRMIKRSPKADAAILLVTLLLTVFADLVVAVNIGVVLAMLHFMKRMSESVNVHRMQKTEIINQIRNQENAIDTDLFENDIVVYSLEGPFFFAGVEALQQAINKNVAAKAVIVRLRWVPFMDATGLNTLEEVLTDLHNAGIRIVLTEANPRVLRKLKRMGLSLGKGFIMPNLESAFLMLQNEFKA